MEFGDRKSFAIECLIDYPMTLLVNCMRSVQGRIRVWLKDEAVGTLDEWGVVLGPAVENIMSIAQGKAFHPPVQATRWHPVLLDLEPLDRHRLCRWVNFGVAPHSAEAVERLRSSEANQDIASKIRETVILTHSAESFDGWGVFVCVNPETNIAHFSWDGPDPERIRFAEVPMEEIQAVVGEFVPWFESEERDWRAPTPQD